MFNKLVLALVLLPACAVAQFMPRSAHEVIEKSGQTVTLSVPGNGATFEELLSGSPVTVSLVVKGCMSGGTCDTLETNTSTTAAQIRTPTFTTLYDYFTVTGSWTGGTNVSIRVNVTSGMHGGGGGGSSFGPWNGVLLPIADDDAHVTWNFSGGSFPNSFGDSRSNQVFRMGWNIGNGGRQNLSEPALAYEMEDYYVPDAPHSGIGVMEMHQVYYGTSGKVVRPLTWAVDRGTDSVDLSIEADNFNLYRAANLDQVLHIDMRGGTGAGVTFINGTDLTVNSGWNILTSSNQANFPAIQNFSIGTVGSTGALVINGLSTQGPNMLSLNNENGLAFAIDNTGAASFGKDVNFNGNNAIFGGGQNIRIGYAAINIANGSTLNWTVDNHAYDTVDTSIGHTPYGGGYGGFRYVLGGSRIDFIANGGALGFNNLDGDIGIYGNGNAGHIVMRSPVHYGDGSTGAVPAYANNAAAIAGGLTAGDTYRIGGDPDQLCIVH